MKLKIKNHTINMKEVLWYEPVEIYIFFYMKNRYLRISFEDELERDIYLKEINYEWDAEDIDKKVKKKLPVINEM